MDDASALQQQAVLAGNDHDFDLLLTLVARARELTDDPDVLDRIDITAAFGEAEHGHYDRAVALCQGVLDRDGALPLARGLAHCQLGMLLSQNSDLRDSNRHLALAVDLLAEFGSAENLGSAYLNRGYNSLRLGHPAAAAADFARSTAYFTEAGNPIGRAKSVFNLGYVHLLQGDLIAALRRMDEGAEVLNQQSAVNRAIHQQDRAEVLVASGRPREAAQALEAAAGIFGAEGLTLFQAECEVILARTVLAHDPEWSRKVAADAARHSQEIGSAALADRAGAAVLRAEIRGGGAERSLLAEADRLSSRLRAQGMREEATSLALYAARLAVRRGELADAAARAAAIRIGAAGRITLTLLASEVRAELATARGQGASVRKHARQGLNELHTWQATFGSLDLQTSVVGHGQDLARLGLRAAVATGRPAVLFEWSERARALGSRVAPLRPPPDAVLAADLTELRLADQSDRARVRALREKIRLRSWFAGAGRVGEPTDLATLRSRLVADDAAMVAHIVLDGALIALVVTGRKAIIVSLGSVAPARALLDRVAADLDFAAHQRGGSVGAAVRASLRTDLAALDDLLVRPVSSAIGSRRVVLTPSALLAGTPWTCLPGFLGRPVTIPTSATRWVEQMGAAAVRPDAVGLVAGPGVPRAEDEVRGAAQAWPGATILRGGAASSARVGQLASTVDLLHIAGHGSHRGDNPLFAAIELADGPWFGHDVDLLPSTPQVVVLSACELGQVSVVHGEEHVGMSAAWVHAGARAVISSPALLADDLACETLGAWHRLVAAGLRPAEALADVTASTADVVPLLCFGAGW